MTTYEYQMMKTEIADMGQKPFLERLNRLGDEGWQLVGTVVRDRHGYSHELHLLLMRAREPRP